jgi:hypothetical protein
MLRELTQAAKEPLLRAGKPQDVLRPDLPVHIARVMQLGQCGRNVRKRCEARGSVRRRAVLPLL